MRAAILPALLLCMAGPAVAQPHGFPPQSIGKFGQWVAAVHPEPGGTTCFAFTRAEAGGQRMPGRGDVVLSVTRRPRSHDVVAISAGMALAGHEDAQLQAGTTLMLFYIAGRSAFARDNAAVLATFAHESSVAVRLVGGAHGAVATDHFSLAGFSGALAAMQKACPA